MITNENELQALCRRAREHGRVAIDTEFFWERTFYPQLGVVQIGLDADDLHLVDAVALPTLPGLGEVLADPGTELILHDAVQDLQILARHTGSLPRRVFDTRRAAGLAGLSSTLSLANLLTDQLAVNLAKAETRSNWLQRPLSNEQVEYALDDIRHLPALCDTLRARATGLGNGEALTEEMQTYDDPAIYADALPEAVYTRFKAGRLRPRQQALLYTLVAWREEHARRRDRPRGHIMQNGDLMAIAQHAPADDAALNGVRGLARNTLQRHRQAILDAIAAADQLPPGTLPDADAAGERLSAEIKKKIQERQHAITKAAQQAGIDPALVGTKADITALVRFETGDSTSPPPARLTTGWRAKLLASELTPTCKAGSPPPPTGI